MEHLLERFNKDLTYNDLDLDFMNELKPPKHIRNISRTATESPLMCYIPHHGIVQPYNLTTVIYDTRAAPFLVGRVILQII